MRRRRAAGFALLAALWGLTLLGFLAAALSGAARTEATIARNQSEAAQAQAAADGGARLAIARLAAVGDAMRRDGAPWTYVLGDAAVSVSVTAAGGLVDLNAAPPALLAAAFRAAGQTPEAAAQLADRVADWRDADDDRRPQGAEASDYAASNAPPPANRRFEALVELKRTLGVDPDLYARALPFFTLQSRRAGIDPRFAPPPLLRALPAVDPQAVEALLARRPLPDDAAVRELGLPAELTASAVGDVLEIFAVARLPGERGRERRAGRRATLRLTGALADPAWLHAWEETP